MRRGNGLWHGYSLAVTKYVPKEITEEVNTTPVHPLVNLANLFAAVAVVSGLIYGGLGIAASQLATRLGPKTEERIGAALTSAFPAKTAEEDSRAGYLEDLLAKLEADVDQTELGKAHYPPLKVRILEVDEENAMVTAGSYLFVTDGLLAAVTSENELAFVLAHELGHLQHRDPLRALGRSLVFVTLSSLLGIGQSTSALPSMINLAELSYSRKQETAADDYAQALVVAHYGHGGYSLGFFERHLEPNLGALSVVAEWQQKHPMSGDRIRRLEDKFEQKGWLATGKATPLPDAIGCENLRCE